MSTSDEVRVGLAILRAVHEGNKLVLSDGWYIGNDQECNYCNDLQAKNMVGIGHPNPDVLETTRLAAMAHNFSGPLMPNLNVRQFVFARRPQKA